ncbi:hypothetical protein [Kozakia baliensis]|uniref:Uncharacterized protein n=1 Tax=Kozakia baliensis TaxID=153496 RepID=A0A1D8UY96_9PROT|nr:hypothetical protein [Kozakia baliensis]AOX18527.1 hypothetical protein A0U89_14645 [Kozakia baliensis]GBR32224.1 hypothetical protein AA0488_2480 [Kozakia baliensis NRIC 0488]GEL65695.1 hypothetical protein KBA01_29810 [Kozakia baliensis]
MSAHRFFLEIRNGFGEAFVGSRSDLPSAKAPWLDSMERYPETAKLTENFISLILENRVEIWDHIRPALPATGVTLGWVIIAGIVSYVAPFGSQQFVHPVADKLGTVMALAMVGAAVFVVVELWRSLPTKPLRSDYEPERRIADCWEHILTCGVITDELAARVIRSALTRHQYEMSLLATRESFKRRSRLVWLVWGQIAGLFLILMMGFSVYQYASVHPECILSHNATIEQTRIMQKCVDDENAKQQKSASRPSQKQ